MTLEVNIVIFHLEQLGLMSISLKLCMILYTCIMSPRSRPYASVGISVGISLLELVGMNHYNLHIYFGITHWPRTQYSLSLLHFFPMIVLSMICFCQLQNIWPAQVCCFWTWTKLKGCFKSLESFPDSRISTNNTKSIFFFYRHKDRLEEGVGEDEAEVKAGSN